MSDTEEQALILANPHENKLICSLPGSGKTYTLMRLADLILEDPSASAMMVTFTNAAMKEMKARSVESIGYKKAKRLTVYTFAKVMLIQHAPLAQGRRLILSGELDNYIYRVAKKLNISYDNIPIFEKLVDTIGRDIYWKPKNDLQSQFFIELQNMLALYKRVDLNTVAREVVIGLQQGVIKPMEQPNFLIDEFQDTDELQYLWMLAHNSQEKRFCVVGDDDQSIYSWRGAVGYQNMVNFQRDLGATAYLMTRCYRCAPMILGLAQRLIEHGEERIYKDMSSARDVPGKVSVRTFNSLYVSPYTVVLDAKPESLKPDGLPSFITDDEIESYRYVVDCIEENYDGWAVLCRTNKHLDCLEYALTERGIPAVRLGGKSIFDSPHAAGIAKLLVGLVFPKAKIQLIDGLGWAGEDESRLQAMYYSMQTGGMASLGVDLEWLDVTTQCHSLTMQWQDTLKDPLQSEVHVQALFSILEKHHKKMDAKMGSIRGSIARVIQNMLMGMKGSFPDRVKKIYDLVTNGVKEKQSHRHPGKVVLCTLTGSKGLEWPRVFIMMVNRQVIPSTQSDESDSIEHIDEERRLLYVGMTRAEDELVLHWHESSPSQYIRELGLI